MWIILKNTKLWLLMVYKSKQAKPDKRCISNTLQIILNELSQAPFTLRKVTQTRVKPSVCLHYFYVYPGFDPGQTHLTFENITRV